MSDLNTQQKHKIVRLAKIANEGPVGIASELDAIEEKVDANYVELSDGVSTAIEIALETQKMEGPPGPKPVAGVDYPIPTNGVDYILTKSDKQEIASLVPPQPPVEKVIERIETVHETPVYTEVQVQVPNTETAVETREKLESLKEDERLDISAIKGVKKKDTKLTEEIINRAIGIVDQRTSFLINKVSNLSTRIDNLNLTGGSSSGFSNFTITRSGDYISSVLVGSTTYTITRSGDYIFSVTNGTQTLTFTRNGSNQITSGAVS